MYSREFVSRVHQELQRRLPASTVLLGGSYQTNEATGSSDLDLFIIVSLFKLQKTKQILQKFRQQFPDKKIRLMVIPRLAYYLGIYFCLGKTVAGEKQQSRFNRKICVANALKLALYYFLVARESGNEVLYKKSAQQAALAWILVDQKNTLPLNSKELHQKIMGEKKFPTLQAILAAKVSDTKILSLQATLKLFAQELISLTDNCREYTGWNWQQYCLYNLKFVPKGEWLFCFRNPDTMVINRLRQAIMQPQTWSGSKGWIKRYVFPIIIY